MDTTKELTKLIKAYDKNPSSLGTQTDIIEFVRTLAQDNTNTQAQAKKLINELEESETAEISYTKDTALHNIISFVEELSK